MNLMCARRKTFAAPRHCYAVQREHTRARHCTHDEGVRGADTVEAVVERLELLVDGAIEQLLRVQLNILWRDTHALAISYVLPKPSVTSRRF